MLQVICRFWMVCKMKVMLSENADVYKEMAACSSVLAWESHGQRSLVGYRPWGCKT